MLKFKTDLMDTKSPNQSNKQRTLFLQKSYSTIYIKIVWVMDLILIISGYLFRSFLLVLKKDITKVILYLF